MEIYLRTFHSSRHHVRERYSLQGARRGLVTFEFATSAGGCLRSVGRHFRIYLRTFERNYELSRSLHFGVVTFENSWEFKQMRSHVLRFKMIFTCSRIMK